jgi:hypothetical protein
MAKRNIVAVGVSYVPVGLQLHPKKMYFNQCSNDYFKKVIEYYIFEYSEFKKIFEYSALVIVYRLYIQIFQKGIRIFPWSFEPNKADGMNKIQPNRRK